MRRKTLLSALVIAVILLGGTLAWYITSRTNGSPTATQATSETSNTLEGTLQSVDCTTTGAGCTDWVLKLKNGDTQGLVVNQDIKTYENKNVRLAGQYVRAFGDSGPTFFEVQSIQILE